MCCMIKTSMEDNGVYRLPNIWTTRNQGAYVQRDVFSSWEDQMMTSGDTSRTTRWPLIPSQAEQTLTRKMKETHHSIEVLRNPGRCAGFSGMCHVRVPCHADRNTTDTWRSQINSSPYFRNLVVLICPQCSAVTKAYRGTAESWSTWLNVPRPWLHAKLDPNPLGTKHWSAVRRLHHGVTQHSRFAWLLRFNHPRQFYIFSLISLTSF